MPTGSALRLPHNAAKLASGVQNATSTPYGYCQCGCGEKTRLAPQSCTRGGLTRGEPMRFIYNHHTSGVRRSPEVVERQYWENVRKCGEDDCWLWSGRVSADGYAMMGHKTKASHFAMTLDGRPRPVAKQANHTCDTPACVNPRHLYWGTQLENIADMKARGRQRNGASR